ncbi:MAG TPA: biotin/lipoyl-binding protein [Firmicutes bacterium]|nr:biotin/lipoyl-binding protein [Candidatus Fermentithermobacillaceae bacterium]
MRRFRIKVDDKVFEVEVEEILGGDVPSGNESPSTGVRANPATLPPAQPVRVPVPRPSVPPAKKDVPVETARVSSPAGPGVMKAPIPGSVSEVKVKPGEAVKRGQVLLLLEAMKMQNEIMAPSDGVVEEVYVSQGQTVNTGDPLLKISS